MNVEEIFKKICFELSDYVTKPELEAWVLLQYGLGVSKERLVAYPKKTVSDEDKKVIELALKKRRKGLPLAYVIGKKEFYGRDFLVNQDVLIPRPESEELIDLIVDSGVSTTADLLDIGTGSGNLAVTLALEFSQIKVDATDISAKALRVARKNAKTYGVEDRINFFKSDLFNDIDTKYDVIVANLPYVPKRYGADKSTFYEPEIAIFGGIEGVDVLFRFLDQAPEYIKKQGRIFMEIDHRISSQVKGFARKKFAEKEVATVEDLAEKKRFIVIG